MNEWMNMELEKFSGLYIYLNKLNTVTDSLCFNSITMLLFPHFSSGIKNTINFSVKVNSNNAGSFPYKEHYSLTNH